MPRSRPVERIAVWLLLLASLAGFGAQLAFDRPIAGVLGLAMLGVPALVLARSAAPALLRWPELLLVTLGAAVAMAVLFGTIASLSPAGLDSRTVAALELPILAATAVAWRARRLPRRGSDLSPEAAERDSRRSLAPHAGTTIPRASTILLGGVGLVLAATGLAIAARAADDQSHPPFVQFWSLPGSGGAAATVGIHNVAGVPLDCVVTIDRPDRAGLTWHPGLLAPDQTLVGFLPKAAADETAPWRLALACTGGTEPLERQVSIEPPR